MKIYEKLQLSILVLDNKDSIRTSGEVVEERDDTAPDFVW